MIWVVSLLFISAVLGHEGHDHSMTKLSLTIYYESLCPDSISFFKNQLIPAHSTFKDHLMLHFVPYGKANYTRVNDTYQFHCHHGEKECYGNIVQACVLKKLFSEENHVSVINCLMSTVDPKTVTNDTYPTHECLKGDKVDKVDKCIKDQEGLHLLAEFGDETSKLSPPLKSVPSVEINKKFSYEASTKAVKDLKSAICKELQDGKKTLKECSGCSLVSSSLLMLVVCTLISGLYSS